MIYGYARIPISGQRLGRHHDAAPCLSWRNSLAVPWLLRHEFP